MGKMAARNIVLMLTFFVFVLMMAREAHSFCGFYVAKADTKLFNQASKVVLVRDEEKTVLTMANDYQGEAKEFAMVIPVPAVLEKDQIHVTENKYIDHLDAYTAPRLVEYHDPNPCEPRVMYEFAAMSGGAGNKMLRKRSGEKKKDYGVKIEASYTVGEYDILILSAKESSGLQDWLVDNGYKVPEEASRVLTSYIKQGLKFFVAKVNLKEKEKLGFKYLRPLQMAFDSKRFGLPIRLGMANAKGSQELFVFALTKKGKVETVNYRTVKIDSDVEVPAYIKEGDEFAKFYKDMFSNSSKKEDNKVVFMEYAWDMNWCDPCAADPLSSEELRQLGVFWVDKDPNGDNPSWKTPGVRPKFIPRPGPGAKDVYVTRLHVRYDEKNFPDDLRFQVTNDRKNYQGRYIIRHPYKGEMKCEEAKNYLKDVKLRQEKEASNLAHLTGRDRNDILKRMNISAKQSEKDSKKWWKKIWN